MNNKRPRRAGRWLGGAALSAAVLVPLGVLVPFGAVPTAAADPGTHVVTAPGELNTTSVSSASLPELTRGSTSALLPAGSRTDSHEPRFGELSATAAVSSTDAWAVGAYPNGSDYIPLAEHWDGKAWKRVPAPAPDGSSSSYLLTVTAVSASDVWAAGAEMLSDGVTMRTLIEHWNGHKWQVVKSPSVDGDWNMLNGIDAASADDVWVVGDGGRGTSISTLVEHWSGHKWRIVSSPNVQDRPVNQLNHVAVISPDDIWAVGYDALLNVRYATLAEHWNGHRWRIVKTPNLHDPNFDLQDVSAVSADDVWATGSYWSEADQRFDTLAERWDGDKWKVVPSPNPKSGSISNFPLAVNAVSANDVWSSGWYELPNADETVLMEHWNGRRWHLTKTPDVPNTPYSNLIGLSGVSANDVWAVGSFYYGGQWSPLYEHWNGRRWRTVT